MPDYADKSNCFNENCHLVREDMLSILSRTNSYYYGSEIQRHIDNSSYEIEHYLKADGDRKAKLEKIQTKYREIKFFSCSALGNNVCLGDNQSNTKEILFRPHPLRLELPIIWLMHKCKMIL